ncbi:D-aminoacylase [Pusillimonas sp. MFBS29]|uniref:N-acyl-D-amino-acid deacylase family protein n=1 Tax=Pusillimonas sp. MFBS29 TaxID=2886690 RepID=UPI001D11CBEF|nr:D-aminoacylase [Pusillimonas sp. MFBS29]MCC2597226.1 D-aminoacylase [Pusillimonas sp. MFBS29]
MSFVISGATLVDGTGQERFQADLAIADGVITEIGKFDIGEAMHVKRADGLMLTPGFIDSHTHDDGYLLAYPDMKPKVSQGITTVVTGNCGISLAPALSDATLPQPLDLLGPKELFRFKTFASWLAQLRATPATVNVVPLVGHTTLRVACMSDTGRAATRAETEAMQQLLEEALEAGAFGMSTGTFYPPAAHAPTREIVEVGAPMKARGGLYATHLRDEADHIVPAMEEALEIGRELESLVVFSHHKLAGSKNHGRSSETLKIIDEAHKTQPVCIDCHPYPATSTMLRPDRVRIAKRTMVTWSKGYPQGAGRDFADIQAELGLDIQGTIDYLAPAGAIYFLMNESDVSRIMSHRLTMVGSDGLPFDSHPHPRQWGTFTRVLRAMVREQNEMTFEQAIHKMTGLPAENYRLKNRGLLRPGYCADLVLLDAERVADRATFEDPIQVSQGICDVWVNGVHVWNGTDVTAMRPGQVLSRASFDRTN